MKAKGFTLVEIMIVVVVVCVISVGILILTIRSLNAYYTVGALDEISTYGSFMIDEMAVLIEKIREYFKND